MHRISIKWKFMAAIVAIAVTILIFCSFLFHSVYALVAERLIDNSAQLVTQVGNRIDSLILSIDNSMLMLTYSNDVKDIFIGELSNLDSVNSQIQNIIESYSDMGIELLMFNKSTKIIASSRASLVGKYRILGAQWINKIHEATGKKVLISGYTVEQDGSGAIRKVISIARSIRSDQNEVLGYIMVEIPIDKLGQICEQAPIGKDGFVAILDSDNYVIYNTETLQIGSQQQLAPTEEEREKHYYFRTVNGNTMLVTDYNSMDAGFLVMGFIPYEETQRDLNVLQGQFIVAILVLVILALIFAYSVSNGISRPIIQMKSHMHRLEQGDFSVRIHSKRQDEIGQLEHGFDHMAEHLEEMIDIVYKSQMHEKEARFQALVSTINPHFIYNTLESISMTAYINNDYQVVEMLHHLAGILRLSSNSKSYDISVSEELNHINSYAYLQSIRCPELFELFCIADDKLLKYRMLRHLLQPLVENSIIHGFRDMDEGGIIEISIFNVGDRVSCVVRDNGKGIKSERLAILNAVLRGEQESEEFFALRNIHERVRLAYGKEYGLEIHNGERSGCIAEIQLPLRGLPTKEDAAQ